MTITDAKALHTWVQTNMPAFLVVDEKGLLSTITKSLVEDKKAGTFAIPANFAEAPIKFELSYKPRISMKTLIELGEQPMNELDLTTPQGVAEHMQQATSEDDWNSRCDIVKRANNKDYPSFWFATIVMSGLVNRVQKSWSK